MSCFGGRDELIYLVELTVERLRLTADKYREDFAERPPLVKLRFLDFPVFEIAPRRNGSSASSSSSSALQSPLKYDETEGLIYACGKSVLFVKKPRDLVAAMKSQPLRLGVFRENETFPIAEASVPLAGCLCDQVAMTGNDSEHWPKPYELVGGFNLLDSGKNFSGSISIFFRLTFFGSHIISHYELYEDCCVFKNDYDGELCVTKMNRDDGENENRFKIGKGTVLAAFRNEGTANKEVNQQK